MHRIRNISFKLGDRSVCHEPVLHTQHRYTARVAVTVHKCQDSRTYSTVYDSVLYSDHPAEFPADAVQQSFIQRFGKTKIGMQHRNSFTGRLLRRPHRIVA